NDGFVFNRDLKKSIGIKHSTVFSRQVADIGKVDFSLDIPRCPTISPFLAKRTIRSLSSQRWYTFTNPSCTKYTPSASDPSSINRCPFFTLIICRLTSIFSHQSVTTYLHIK